MNKETKIVYALECSSGSWDGHTTWTDGIFSSIDEANTRKEKLNAKANYIKNNRPFKDKITDEMTEEEEAIYDRYYAKNELFMGWEEPNIKEYILNQPIKDFCPKCFSEDIIQTKKDERTSGPSVPGKLMSYFKIIHTLFCNECKYTYSWEESNQQIYSIINKTK